MKKCSKCSKLEGCDIFKPFAEFNKDKSKKDGYYPSCKSCCYKKYKKWYNDEDNRKITHIKNNKYYKINKEAINKQTKEKYEIIKHTEEFKNKRKLVQQKYRNSNKEKIKEYNDNYREENKELIKERVKPMKKEYDRRYRNKKRLDPHYKMNKLLRSRLKNIIKNHDKKVNIGTTKKLISCSIFFFCKWIEYQFDPYMSWENHGTYWHLDHVKPMSMFNLLISSDRIKCMHWSNLRPLKKEKNLEKSNKYDFKIEHLHLIVIKSFKLKIKNKELYKIFSS